MGRAGHRFVLFLGAFALVATACGTDDGAATGGIVRGKGVIPESIPSNFPIPADAEVGASTVDAVNNRTELRLTMSGTVTRIVQFFEVGLVNQGYVVDSSAGNASEWNLRFSDGPLDGRIEISEEGSWITAVVSVNTS